MRPRADGRIPVQLDRDRADHRLAPRFNLKAKTEPSGLVEGLDYGEEGYDPNRCNAAVNQGTGEITIEIKRLIEPKSDAAPASLSS